MANLLYVELSEEEASVLLQLIHIAVQSKGLDAAQAGLHFQQKINAALAESKKAEPGGEAQPIDCLTK